MTYADTATALRRELSDLLIEAEVPKARFKHSLTAEESLLVQRYRASILTWINRTTQAVVPDDASRWDWRWGPARHFADQLNRVVVVTVALTPPAGTVELGTLQQTTTVERWRRAAVAATTGLDRELRSLTNAPDPALRERHETLGVVGPPPDNRQLGADYGDRLRIVDDDAALTNALILLDVRTGGRPGWHRLGGIKDLSPRREVSTEGLLNALELCRRWTRAHDLPTTVDQRGHRAAPALVPGPIGAGMPGLHDAVHNTALRLTARPRGDVMRLLIRSQAALSDALVRTVSPDDPSHPALATRRAQYLALARESGNLGGHVGAGLDVLIESETARGVLTTVQAPQPGDVARIVSLLRTIDDKIAAHVRHGARDTTYVVRDGRHLGAPGPGGVRPAADEWKPLNYRTAPELLRAAAGVSPPDGAPSPRPAAPQPGLAVGPTRAAFDETLADSTPVRTASRSPLAGETARTELSNADRQHLRAAAAATPAVQDALQDYLLRRPHQGGGTAAGKGHGKDPSPEAITAATGGQRSDTQPCSTAPPRSGRSMQDRSTTPMSTSRPSLGPPR